MNIKLLVCCKVFREKFQMENFCGSNNILALLKSGSFIFETKHQNCTVRKNEAVIFRENVLYKRKVIEPAELYLFRFSGDNTIFSSDYITFKDTCRIESTMEMLENLEGGIFNDAFAFEKNLFYDIITQYCIENGVCPSKDNKKEEPAEKAIAYISENLHKKFTLSEIAPLTGLSYVQFLRRFQSYTGMTPAQYVAQMRVQKAKNLLVDGELLIKEIAQLCGFENEYYFSNFFKKQTGVSPSQFRNSKV